MPRILLTERNLEALVPAAGDRQTDYFDSRLPGFGLRVTSTRKTWFVMYRTRTRRLRRLTIGPYSGAPKGQELLKLQQARAIAREKLIAAALGDDPALEKRESRNVHTLGQLWTEYLEKHAKRRKKSWREDASLWRRKWDQLKHRPLPDLKRQEIREVLDAIAEGGAPVLANRALALIRKVLNFGIEREWLEHNPAEHIARPGGERARERVLTDDEIRKVWAACDSDTLEAGMGTWFKLRLLTAQRGGEVVRLRWQDLDLEVGWWTIPGEFTKNGLAHRVPLVVAAVELLKERQAEARKGAVWVFPSYRPKRPAVQVVKGQTKILAAAAGVADFRGHDLRRTAATRMGEAGVSRFVIGRVLNHVEPGVTAVYDRATYDQEKRLALEQWGRTLARILTKEKQPGGKVLLYPVTA